MGSQTDLDQGGTVRQTQKVYLGPSIGWVMAASGVVLPITAGGTTNVVLGNSLITVNHNGAVTVQLPSSKPSSAGATAQPGTYPIVPLTIVDIGGFAASHPITILPYSGETIDGLTSITIQAAYGAYVLSPNQTSGGWTLTQ